MLLRFVYLIAFTLGLIGASAKAHEITPAIADLSFSAGEFQVAIALNLEALVGKVGVDTGTTQDSVNAAEYDRLRLLEPAELAAAFDSFSAGFLQEVTVELDGVEQPLRVVSVNIPEVGDVELARGSTLVLAGPVPDGAQNLTWQWAQSFGAIVLRAPALPEAGVEAEPYTAYLTDGAKSEPIGVFGAEPKGFLETVREYIWIGFTHIVPKGLDHILFVVGLFLLSTHWSPLLWQVTAFTVAHTVSLALGMLGIVAISPAIVEPLIALSIAYVAIENVFLSGLSRWRPFVVFGFGLLHGLGFAGVLTEVGLSSEQFVVGLISFNVGVELGQLAVIAVCYLCVGYWFGEREWYRPRITIPLSLAIAAIGLYWTVERAFLA
jgi:hypothetical protein